jgi:hypothetical protein
MVYRFREGVSKIFIYIKETKNKQTNKLRGLSTKANYTDRANRRLSAKLVPTFVDRGCGVVSATDPPGRNLGFLDRSRYYLFPVAPQLYSRG